MYLLVGLGLLLVTGATTHEGTPVLVMFCGSVSGLLGVAAVVAWVAGVLGNQ